MLRAMRCAPALLALAGCLTTPSPAQPASDGGSPTPDADPEPPDGGSLRCELPATTVAFPPAGTVTVAPGAVVDLDCDGLDEIVLLVRAQGLDAPSQGIYILVGATGEAVFVPTGADAPGGLIAEDLGGDAHLDLLVVTGRDTVGDPRVNEEAWLVALEGGPGFAFTRVGERFLNTHTPDVGTGEFSRAWLTTLELDGDPARELMFNLPRHLYTAELAWGTAGLLTADPVELGGEVWNGGEMVAFPSPGHPGLDDLVLNNLVGIVYYRNPADGSVWTTFHDEQPVVSAGGFRDTRIFVQLDGDGIPDAVGASQSATDLGAGVVRITPTGRGFFSLTDPIDDEVESVGDTAVGRFDPGSLADLALLDGDELVVRADLTLFGGEVRTQPARRFTFATPAPDFLVVGHFVRGGGQEIVGVSFAGARQCVVVSATAISACP
jgi:hypothetical protein